MKTIVRQRIEVSGIVQGVGFRPFVWHAAQMFRCTGWVRNCAAGVEIELQGSVESIMAFVAILRQSPPPMARVDGVTLTDLEAVIDEQSFRILESRPSPAPSVLALPALVSPDIATCQTCLDEMRDPQDRRYGYPFINCTECGPRFTIQQAVPYDRARTTMAGFAMCELCAAEYQSPGSRRFHSQPNACPVCGPAIWLVDPSRLGAQGTDQAVLAERPEDPSQTNSTATILAVRQAIAAGLIVAVKGIGGFHLACDARQSEAIQRLRARKQRPFKPLAVMAADLATASSIVLVSDAEQKLLTSPERPIVLMRKRGDARLPEELAPHNPDLGVLLPYSPLHHLLLQTGDVWVMTSGNLADEPIAYDNMDALRRLGSIADCFLLHDRPIHVVCDDSVIRSTGLGPIPIRRGRGYAPLPVMLPQVGPTVLAVGGELKNAMCLMTGQHAFMGPHTGDMGNVQTLTAAQRSAELLQTLYHAKPDVIAADLHPGYLSTQLAHQLVASAGVPIIKVQHHHAHAGALMAEYQLPPEQPIIACVLDGTGFGCDGAIWGGEVLVANAKAFHRAAHFEYVLLPGGDQCILHPARTALAYLYSSGIRWAEGLPCVQFYSAAELKLLRTQLDQRLNTVATSSAGRLFDAVASLLGLRHKIDYEGQAAMELEFLAESAPDCAEACEGYPCQWTTATPSCLRIQPILEAIQSELHCGTNIALVAYRFHVTIALALAERCQAIRQAYRPTTLNQVGLSGGVFQNALLLQLTQAALSEAGFEVLIHRLVPPNDGGLALGQALVARLSEASDRSG